jgi:RNA polymerase sigma-70 factor (ECF subfamily)
MQDLDALWPAIARADAEAFARFLAGAELPLRRSLAGFARSVDVEAVVQESLLRLWQVAPRFEPDGRENGLFRLCVRIARNLALDEVKRCRRAHLLEDATKAIADPSVETAADPLFRNVVVGCLDALPPKPALALRARLDDGGGEPDDTLASRCQMTLNTFLQNVTRARRLLAECLQKRAGWEPSP